MFALRYTGKLFFTLIGGCKYYRKRFFMEQATDGTYIRPLAFFIRHRMDIVTNPDFQIHGIGRTMSVMYEGREGADAVRIGGVLFPRGRWQDVPIDFDSTDERGNDQFVCLSFRVKVHGSIKDTLDECADGERLLVLRKFGGLGDVIMQSLMFPDLRRRFPRSEITYAVPRRFHPLFDGCTDIDRLIDSADVELNMMRLLASGEYQFIGDVSSCCAAYEVDSIKARGYVDKERADIWAESMGLTLDSLHSHGQAQRETCIRITDRERDAAAAMLDLDGRRLIGVTPYSNAPDRGYPHLQELIDRLNAEGDVRVLLFHSEPVPVEGAEQIVGLDLRTLGGVISHLDLMISADTGPLHYAGILGVPVIGLFGVTESNVRLTYYDSTALQGHCPKQEHPCWGGRSSTCTGPDGRAVCMNIPVDDVISAMRKVLFEGVSGSRG